MNHRFRLLLLAAVFLAGAIAPAAKGETEPNGTRAQANTLTLTSSGQAATTGIVYPISDLDYFKIVTPSFSGQKTLTITMTPTSSDLALSAWVQLLDINGIFLAEAYPPLLSDGFPQTLTFTQSVGSTTYYIVCRSADSLVFGTGDYTLQVGLPIPNLSPFQLNGWSDKIVVSTVTGTTTDSSSFTTTNTLYVDWAIANIGTGPTAARFYTDLYVDGVSNRTWGADPPLNTNSPIGILDHSIGQLSAGTHTIKIVTDSTGAVSESNGSDNEYTKTITVVDDDLNDQISQAIVLGSMTQTKTADGLIGSPTDVDMYSFTVTAGQRISFDIDFSTGLNSYLRLFNASGTQLAVNDNAHGPGPEETSPVNSYLEYTFASGGTYYLGVSASGNTSYNVVTGTGDSGGSTAGAYTLVVSPGFAGTAKRDGDTTDYLVDILKTDGKAIDPTVRTWIVTHGWTSSRTDPNIAAVASSLATRYPFDQVLTLDWSAAAVSALQATDGAAEDAIKNVGIFAANALLMRGFTGDKLNLVGHSWGSYVSDELAERIPGGVNSIVALDPGEDHPFNNYYDPHAANEISFAQHSAFSWAFYSFDLTGWLGLALANAGDEETPTTADEAFVVQGTTHGDIVFMFAWMILNPTDVVGRYFVLDKLLTGSYGAWLPDQYSVYSGPYDYEAVITANIGGTSAQSISFLTNTPILTIASPANGATVTSSPVLLSGTATDFGRGNNGISSVTINGVRANNDIASGTATANWNKTFNLIAGTNVITVVARDNSAQQSPVTNTITVRFTPMFTITAFAGAGGSINPSGGIMLNAGSNQSFTATPNTNYTVNQWLLDGSTAQTGGNTFTLTNLQANRTVQVTFAAVPVTPPTLAIALSNSSVVLSWPTNFYIFTLQQTETPASIGSWLAVSTSPTIVGSSNIVTVPISPTNQFFRLLKP